MIHGERGIPRAIVPKNEFCFVGRPELFHGGRQPGEVMHEACSVVHPVAGVVGPAWVELARLIADPLEVRLVVEVRSRTINDNASAFRVHHLLAEVELGQRPGHEQPSQHALVNGELPVGVKQDVSVWVEPQEVQVRQLGLHGACEDLGGSCLQVQDLRELRVESEDPNMSVDLGSERAHLLAQTAVLPVQLERANEIHPFSLGRAACAAMRGTSLGVNSDLDYYTVF